MRLSNQTRPETADSIEFGQLLESWAFSRSSGERKADDEELGSQPEGQLSF
jgi:hypothetical protein